MPFGRLVVETRQGEQSSADDAIFAAFQKGDGVGLLALAASARLEVLDGGSFVFWRGFANACLAALAHMPESADGTFPDSVPMPEGLAFDLTLRLYHPSADVIKKPEKASLPVIERKGCA